MKACDDVSALIRLLRYAESEAERLGLKEAAWLLDMPIQSISDAGAINHPGPWASEPDVGREKLG